jgi:hypothetical protein
MENVPKLEEDGVKFAIESLTEVEKQNPKHYRKQEALPSINKPDNDDLTIINVLVLTIHGR